MRDNYSECVPHGTCYDEAASASAEWSGFELLILIFLLGLVIWLIARLANPPKPEKTIDKYVSDKLKDYEAQARLFGRTDAERAFQSARFEIDTEFAKRNVTESQRPTVTR